MQKLIILFSFIIFNSFQSGFAQDKTNQFDEKGEKNGLWKGFYEDSKKLRYQGTFEHGLETGMFKFYTNSEVNTLAATRTFSKNGLVADNVFFDVKGNIISKGSTINKLNEGVWTFFHEGATEIRMTENYAKGKLTGVKKIFYKSKNIAEESNYKNGLKTGLYKIYAENGVVLEESNFKNGEYNGLAIFRAPNGKIASQGNFVNGAKKGKWQFFENGKLKKEVMMPEKIKLKKAIVKKVD